MNVQRERAARRSSMGLNVSGILLRVAIKKMRATDLKEMLKGLLDMLA